MTIFALIVAVIVGWLVRDRFRRSSTPPAQATSQPPPTSPVDDTIFKAYQLYLSERTRLSAGKQEQAKTYDQTILTYSAGAIALSITFLDKVIKNPNARGWLYTSWILFAVAMLSTLYSFLASQRAFEGEIGDLDSRYKHLIGLPPPAADKSSPSTPWGVPLRWLETFAHIFSPTLNFFRQAVKWLNRLAAIFFVAGVLCFGWFALENWILLKGEPGVRKTTSTTGDRGDVPQQPGVSKLPGGLTPDGGVLPPINNQQTTMQAPPPQPTHGDSGRKR